MLFQVRGHILAINGTLVLRRLQTHMCLIYIVNDSDLGCSQISHPLAHFVGIYRSVFFPSLLTYLLC